MKPPKPVTPITSPPPDPLAPVAKRAENLRAILGAAGLCVLLGVAYATWSHDVVRSPQLEQVRAGAGAALAATSATTTAQLGALQSAMQDMRTHQAAVDATLADMVDDMHWIRDQLTAVARATGAKPVPTP
jgi:predicted metal-dependent HD superfamily phosphohydrolase